MHTRKQGSGIAQWVERQTRDQKVCEFESRQEQWENFLFQGQLSVLTLISVSVPPPCYRSSIYSTHHMDMCVCGVCACGTEFLKF